MQEPRFVPSGGGEDYDYSQDHCYVKLSSKDTNGQLCVVEDRLKRGFKLGRHHHKQMTEVFYVLEGEITFRLDDQTLILKPGDTLTVPPHVWHAAECPEGGRMLTIFQNGRFDEFLKRLRTMHDGQLAAADSMRALAEEFDIYEDAG